MDSATRDAGSHALGACYGFLLALPAADDEPVDGLERELRSLDRQAGDRIARAPTLAQAARHMAVRTAVRRRLRQLGQSPVSEVKGNCETNKWKAIEYANECFSTHPSRLASRPLQKE